MSDKTIIEVNGVKLEVDLRTAVRIDTLKVGSKVKVLVKEYSDHKVYPGVVVGFEPFRALPTIIVAYVKSSWNDSDIQFIYYNAGTKDTEIVCSVDDVLIDHNEVYKSFDIKKAKLERELAELTEKRDYFTRQFGVYFSDLQFKGE